MACFSPAGARVMADLSGRPGKPSFETLESSYQHWSGGRQWRHCILTTLLRPVIPAKAGIQANGKNWTPAFAG